MRLLFAHILHAPKNGNLYERLAVINTKLNDLLKQIDPIEVAIEDTFYGKNARSAFHLGIARGVAVSACLNRGMTIFEYAPTQVKSVVTGYGRADKTQVAKMVRLIAGIGHDVELGFDATDAIAVAICHASTVRLAGATC